MNTNIPPKPMYIVINLQDNRTFLKLLLPSHAAPIQEVNRSQIFKFLPLQPPEYTDKIYKSSGKIR